MNLSKVEVIVDNELIKNKRKFDYEKNIWKLSDIGIKPLPYTRASYISFEKINPVLVITRYDPLHHHFNGPSKIAV